MFPPNMNNAKKSIMFPPKLPNVNLADILFFSIATYNFERKSHQLDTIIKQKSNGQYSAVANPKDLTGGTGDMHHICCLLGADQSI